jgi:hypothetical protein
MNNRNNRTRVTINNRRRYINDLFIHTNNSHRLYQQILGDIRSSNQALTSIVFNELMEHADTTVTRRTVLVPQTNNRRTFNSGINLNGARNHSTSAVRNSNITRNPSRNTRGIRSIYEREQLPSIREIDAFNAGITTTTTTTTTTTSVSATSFGTTPASATTQIPSINVYSLSTEQDDQSHLSDGLQQLADTIINAMNTNSFNDQLSPIATLLWDTLNNNTGLDDALNNLSQDVVVRPTETEIANGTDVLYYRDLSNATATGTCPITQNNFEDDTRVMIINECGHVFEETALRQWFRVNTKCPVCRHDIRTTSINTNMHTTTTTTTQTASSSNT